MANLTTTIAIMISMKNKIFLGASRQGSGKASRHPLNKKTPQASDPLKSSYNNFKLLV
ncbi:hypothetical protein RhiirA1_470733 [Rhizophagus irregularis]|uniref:Uncharacterized protein n=1 Tax=Rhizophagus irregularis TaxID=588596 RepID=A0A2N0R5K3_9GLOM|nr:hypothetical protein RhiirA1_470733 [Rhizophagus irregularis]